MKYILFLLIFTLVSIFFISCSRTSTESDTQTLAATEPKTELLNKEKAEISYELPPSARENPQEFQALAKSMLELPPSFLYLVDKNHALPEDFVPADIVNLNEYPAITTGREGMKLERRAAEALAEMSEAAERDGVKLVISSSYRSYNYQKALFQRYAEKDGEEAAARYSAKAGTSQHQLGTTVDFGPISDSFAESPAGIWMARNGRNYGWSLSYPAEYEDETGYKWESWHWRFIGTAAVKMQEDYFQGIQQRLLLYWNENASRIREALEKTSP